MHSKRWMHGAVLAVALIFAAGSFTAGLRAQSRQSPLHVPANPKPFYVINFVDIVPQHAGAGTKEVGRYVRDTRKEPGIISIIALAQISRPNHLIVYEVWKDKAAYDVHVAGKNSIEFRTTMRPMLGAPFDQRPQWRID